MSTPKPSARPKIILPLQGVCPRLASFPRAALRFALGCLVVAFQADNARGAVRVNWLICVIGGWWVIGAHRVIVGLHGRGHDRENWRWRGLGIAATSHNVAQHASRADRLESCGGGPLFTTTFRASMHHEISNLLD